MCSGTLWKGADGKTRKCFTVVANFQVDYMEACTLALFEEANQVWIDDPQAAEMLIKAKGLVNDRVCALYQ